MFCFECRDQGLISDIFQERLKPFNRLFQERLDRGRYFCSQGHRWEGKADGPEGLHREQPNILSSLSIRGSGCGYEKSYITVNTNQPGTFVRCDLSNMGIEIGKDCCKGAFLYCNIKGATIYLHPDGPGMDAFCGSEISGSIIEGLNVDGEKYSCCSVRK